MFRNVMNALKQPDLSDKRLGAVCKLFITLGKMRIVDGDKQKFLWLVDADIDYITRLDSK